MYTAHCTPVITTELSAYLEDIIVKAVNYYFGNGFFVNYAKPSITMQNASIAIFLDALPPIKNELNEKVAT